jgi:hypothetical protein
MGDIDVGGDRSVMWKVNAGNLRLKTAFSHPAGQRPPEGHGLGPHHQEGIDETNPGNFTITIKVPATPQDWEAAAKTLAAASATMNAATPGSRATVSFSLPIERENEDQIKITWDSAP